MNVWGFFILLSLNQHSSQEIFDSRFHTLVRLDLEVHVPLNWTEAGMIQGDVLFNQGFMEETF